LRNAALLAALAVVIATACRDAAISDGEWISERSDSGDTTVVHTLSGSVWERPARLSEELRIGQIDGEEETAFGDVSHVAVVDDGHFFVFDSQVPRLMRFSPAGEFLGAIGREGQGPGEYSARVTGMLVVGNELLVADPGNSRNSAFSLEGEYLGSRGEAARLRSLFARTLQSTSDDGFAVRILATEPAPGERFPPLGLELRRSDGTVSDTVPAESLRGSQPRDISAIPSGGVLVSADGEFMFELRHDPGRVVRIEMPFERVEYTEGELRIMGRALAPVAAADGETEANPDRLKPPYLEFLHSDDGRVWARRPIADSDPDLPSWRAPVYQPSVLDVFEGDGTFLGVVPVPQRSRPVAVGETHLFVVELGEFDEPYVVRYRISYD
jgi:6-bladed beta-propeller protein